jgi:hypothetical protein
MTSQLLGEITSNFSTFEKKWPKDLVAAQSVLDSGRDKFLQSYLRVASLQAWRTNVIMGLVDGDSEAFFFEAQNDLLVSHCLARCGSFRQALKALRSAIENVYFALYYKDHSVELAKWNLGKHKLGFTELQSYFESHPAIEGHGQEAGLDTIKAEYSTLSKAVHGSAKGFRMTKNLDDIQLWQGDVTSIGKWATREKAVVTSVNLLLCHLFRESLLGTKNRGLREVMSLVIPKAKHSAIKTRLGINIPSS